MDEQDRGFSAGLAIAGEQCAQSAHEHVGGRQRISSRAGRADGGALPAAGADVVIDRHVIAGGRDGAGRAEIEAAGAADDLGAGMSAEILGEGDVAGLVEGTDEIACLEHGAKHGRRIAGIGPQIAVAQIGGGEQRRAAGEIEHQIAARHRAVARRTKGERGTRRGCRLRIAVDDELEGAEIPGRGSDRTPHHRKIGHPRAAPGQPVA